MKYKNPKMKKIKRSHPMLVSCGVCKVPLILYQKQGIGTLLRLHIERVIESEMQLTSQNLTCPECDTVLGHKVTINDEESYKMLRSNYNTKFIK